MQQQLKGFPWCLNVIREFRNLPKIDCLYWFKFKYIISVAKVTITNIPPPNILIKCPKTVCLVFFEIHFCKFWTILRLLTIVTFPYYFFSILSSKFLAIRLLATFYKIISPVVLICSSHTLIKSRMSTIKIF